jgi:AcrR family transcriptional regulator
MGHSSAAATRLRRRRPLRGAPEDTRARLVAAAADLFNRHGYHGTDSNRIARRAGYAAGTFYKHFSDKREILLAAYEAWVSEEWREIQRELASAGDAEDLAARIVALVLRHHRRWRGLRASLAALVAQDPEGRRFYRAQRRRQLELLRSLRERGGAPVRSAEEDAVLLFTLERVCDAVAGGEDRDLGLDQAELLGVVRAMIRNALPRPGA